LVFLISYIFIKLDNSLNDFKYKDSLCLYTTFNFSLRFILPEILNLLFFPLLLGSPDRQVSRKLLVDVLDVLFRKFFCIPFRMKSFKIVTPILDVVNIPCPMFMCGGVGSLGAWIGLPNDHAARAVAGRPTNSLGPLNGSHVGIHGYMLGLAQCWRCRTGQERRG
jgi:hypothetical protein